MRPSQRAPFRIDRNVLAARKPLTGTKATHAVDGNVGSQSDGAKAGSNPLRPRFELEANLLVIVRGSGRQ